MGTLLVVVATAQLSGCRVDATALLAEATRRARALDAASLISGLVPAEACDDLDAARAYARGLDAASKAYAAGGSPDSLRPVADALALLERHADRFAPARIASHVLQAAMAAAQSEREAMALFLAQATQIEWLQLAAGLPGAPLVTAHEAAGDLWLRVHGYADARDAYLLARSRVGSTPRIAVGLARLAVRLKDTAAACSEYRAVAGVGAGQPVTPAVAEARAFLEREPCRPDASEAPPRR